MLPVSMKADLMVSAPMEPKKLHRAGNGGHNPAFLDSKLLQTMHSGAMTMSVVPVI